MKNILFLILLFISIGISAQTDYSMPETPKRIEFANVIVNLDIATQKRVNNYVVGLLTPQNSYLEGKLQLMQWYFPYIEAILEKENVPDDLKYLAVQESALKPDALSSSAAVGFWQFKEATGRELGLTIDNNIDERKYIFASTKAAASYFRKNNIIFKNWVSCIYAYNQGPTGATKDIPASWSYASEIDFDDSTPDYLLKALAHRIAFEHRLNRLKKSPKKLIEYPTRGKSLAEIAVELTVDLSELREYNAWLYSASIPTTKDYTVLIPINASREQEILAQIQKRRELTTTDKGYPILVRKTLVTTSDNDPILYEINEKKGILAEPGDEASQLAKKGDIVLSYFLKFNDLDDKHLVKTGQVYYLEQKSKKGPTQFHTVSKSQTFWEISQMYGIRLKNLLKYNRLKSPEDLQPGRVVWLQKKRPKNQPVEIIQEVINEELPSLPVQTRYKRDDVVLSEAETNTTNSRTNTDVIKLSTQVQEEEIDDKPVVVKRVEREPARPEKVESKPVTVISKPNIEPSEPVRASTSYSLNPASKMHYVTQGETLFSISKKYNLSVGQLRNLNGMSTSDILQYGQQLIVSEAGRGTETRPTTVITSSKRPNQELSYHTVQRGETLYSLSKQYNTTVVNIQKWNNLSGTEISIGEQLIVSQDGTNSTSNNSQSASTHTVSKGETLYSISKRYDITLGNLKSMNNLSDNTISVGQVLRIR